MFESAANFQGRPGEEKHTKKKGYNTQRRHTSFTPQVLQRIVEATVYHTANNFAEDQHFTQCKVDGGVN